MQKNIFLLFTVLFTVHHSMYMHACNAAPLKSTYIPNFFSETRPESGIFQQIANAMPRLFGDDAFHLAEAYMKELEIIDIPTSDNITLRTRMWVPRGWQVGDPPLTTLYDRTPYGAAYTAISMIWALDGYAICMQDQRGTGGSGGEFEIWKQDYADGVTTIAWIVDQPWSNGKVVTWGISADAVSVYPFLNGVVPELKAVFPILGVDNGHLLVYPQGIYRQGLTEDWLRSVCTPCIDEVKENELDSEWWDLINGTGKYGNIEYESVHLAGWWDIFLTGQIHAFKGFLHESPDAWRSSQKLVVEAHGHCYQAIYPQAFPGLLLGLQLGREMFQRAHNGQTGEKVGAVTEFADAVTFYVMGPIGITGAVGNWYVTLPDWPVATPQSYYLAPGGVLQNNVPTQQSSSTYFYDPLNPVEHYGGNNLGGTCGPLVQNDIEARSDVLSFTTTEFTVDTAFVGAIRAVLYVSTNRNDTDFIAKVNDVHPNGESHLLSEGAMRMRLRESGYYYSSTNPGQIYEVVIDIWETAYVFNVGHRLRLTVMSSSWDRWGINNNNFAPIHSPATPVTATNTVYFGLTYPSRVELPFVNFSQIPEANFEF